MSSSRCHALVAPLVLFALGLPLSGCGVQGQEPTAEESQAQTTKTWGNFCTSNLDCGDGSMGSRTCDYAGRCDSCRLNGCIYNRNCTFDHRTPYACPGCYRTMKTAACDQHGSDMCIGCPAGSVPDSLLLTCVVSCGIAAAEPPRERLMCERDDPADRGIGGCS